jgi:hypothetical protein
MHEVNIFRVTGPSIIDLLHPQNRYAAWLLARAQGNDSIPQPALAIYPLDVIQFRSAVLCSDK